MNSFLVKILRRLKIEVVGLKLLFCRRIILLVGTEDFGNFGDHHIAISEQEFCKKFFPGYYVFEIPASIYYSLVKILKKYIRRDVIIFMTGGGNLGDEYLYSENIRRNTMKEFQRNPIFIFPQTIYFKDTNSKEFKRSMNFYNSHPNLHLFVRERYSYEFAQKYFTCKIRLVPDIVLFSQYPINNKRNGVSLCFRRDREKSITENEVLNMEELLKKYYKKLTYIDTQVDYNIKIQDRKQVIQQFIHKLSSSEIVITDRLHGMVFCAITQTPCIAVGNYNYKVKGIYDWIRNLNYIHFLENTNEVEEKVWELRILKREDFTKLDMSKEFLGMQKYIKEVVGKKEGA